MSSVKGFFHPRLRAYQVWGTRPGVGKTVASTTLCLGAILARGPKGAWYNVAFCKPIDETAEGESNDRERLQSVMHKWRAGKGLPKWFDTSKPFNDQDDAGLLRDIKRYANLRADHFWSDRGQPPPGSWLFLETLANVEARLPSRNCQADVYRELNFPGILVGDTQPGGVEDTISAFKALRQRDYDVQSVIVFKDPNDNHVRIAEHFQKIDIPCVALRAIPERHPERDRTIMLHYYSSMARANVMKDLIKHFQARHAERVKAVEELSKVQGDSVTWSSSEGMEEAPGTKDGPHFRPHFRASV